MDVGLRAIDRLGLVSAWNSDDCPVRVLMYHGVLPQCPSQVAAEGVDRFIFRRHMQYLKKRFQLLHANELAEALAKPASGTRPQIALTFDDGLGNNATVVRPILEELQIPAIFFVSLRHTVPGRLLWFTHARALFACHPAKSLFLLGRNWPLSSSAERSRSWAEFCHISRLVGIGELYASLEAYPVMSFVSSETVENEMRGMTEREIAAIAASKVISIGAHTVNHPYLTRCSEAELREEILGSKIDLQRICGRPIILFAYPDGDYDDRVVREVRNAGFLLGFAVNRRGPGCNDIPEFTIRRAGIYRGGTGLLAAKAYGWLN